MANAEAVTSPTGSFSVWKSSPQEIENIIHAYEIQTQSKFISYRKDGTYGKDFDPGDSRGRKTLWQSSAKKNKERASFIEYDGIPFFVLGLLILGCHRGVDKGRKQKERNELKRMEQMSPDQKALAKRGPQTKKLDCPAQIHVTKAVKFPSFKAEQNTQRRKEKMSRALKDALSKTPDDVEYEVRYYIRLPGTADHVGHPVGVDGALLEKKPTPKLESVVEDKIKDLVMDGLTDTDQVLKQCRQYSKDTVFAGQKIGSKKQHRGYFPVKSQVQRCIDKMLYGVEESLSDDEEFIYMNTQELSDIDISKPIRRLRRECRCLLHQIFVTTYHIKDDNILKQLKHNLQALLLSLKKCIPENQYLIPPQKKRKRATGTQTRGPPLKKLKSTSVESANKPSIEDLNISEEPTSQDLNLTEPPPQHPRTTITEREKGLIKSTHYVHKHLEHDYAGRPAEQIEYTYLHLPSPDLTHVAKSKNGKSVGKNTEISLSLDSVKQEKAEIIKPVDQNSDNTRGQPLKTLTMLTVEQRREKQKNEQLQTAVRSITTVPQNEGVSKVYRSDTVCVLPEMKNENNAGTSLSHSEISSSEQVSAKTSMDNFPESNEGRAIYSIETGSSDQRSYVIQLPSNGVLSDQDIAEIMTQVMQSENNSEKLRNASEIEIMTQVMQSENNSEMP